MNAFAKLTTQNVALHIAETIHQTIFKKIFWKGKIWVTLFLLSQNRKIAYRLPIGAGVNKNYVHGRRQKHTCCCRKEVGNASGERQV
jgi:hypothetical protein